MTTRRWLPFAVLAVIVLVWEISVVAFRLNPLVLPAPDRVFLRFLDIVKTGQMLRDLGVTLQEIAIGFGAGLLAGLVGGVILARNELLEKIISPFILIFQTAPKISLAPLFVLWFGWGITSKAVLIALVTFFPILLNIMVGIRSTNPDYLDLLRIFKANPWQRLVKVELMNALPYLMTGMRIGLVLSVTAAIIGEMMNAKAGLGFLLMTGNEMYDISLVMSAIIVISLLSYVLDLAMKLLQEKMLFWHESSTAGGESA